MLPQSFKIISSRIKKLQHITSTSLDFHLQSFAGNKFFLTILSIFSKILPEVSQKCITCYCLLKFRTCLIQKGAIVWQSETIWWFCGSPKLMFRSKIVIWSRFADCSIWQVSQILLTIFSFSPQKMLRLSQKYTWWYYFLKFRTCLIQKGTSVGQSETIRWFCSPSKSSLSKYKTTNF